LLSAGAVRGGIHAVLEERVGLNPSYALNRVDEWDNRSKFSAILLLAVGILMF